MPLIYIVFILIVVGMAMWTGGALNGRCPVNQLSTAAGMFSANISLGDLAL